MLRSAQSEPIVFRLPQSQTHQALLKRAIDLRPQRVDNIFAGRGSFAKLFYFEIEMFVAPRRDGLTQYASEFLKIGERAGTFIIFAANCALHHVAMAVPAWVVALAEELCVLGIGKGKDMQSVRSTELFANA